MENSRQSEESIFHEALAIVSVEARDEYLRSVCAGCPELLTSVRTLLNAYPGGAFLDTAIVSDVVEECKVSAFRIDSSKGSYRVLRQIGFGGMGSVYLAEQLQPDQKMVAIKIIRPGLDNRVAVKRFSQEHYVLSILDHPGIVKVLDASISGSQFSCFVMEFVQGIPVLSFCDAHHVQLNERLRLFVDCCRAIQHSHEKGVIHCDIKPSNILVELRGSEPVVKIIDFGIARLVGSKFEDVPLVDGWFHPTRADCFGTPQFMSPEQASLLGRDLDVRTDVYSLGALLYAMLTGETPIPSARFNHATMSEICQIVCEEVPVALWMHPSMTRYRLSGQDCGHLDQIVMKALQKDRENRYSTVSELVVELENLITVMLGEDEAENV